MDQLISRTIDKGIPIHFKSLCYRLFVNFYIPWTHTNPSVVKLKTEYYEQYLKQQLSSGSIPSYYSEQIRDEMKHVSTRIPCLFHDKLQHSIELTCYLIRSECLFDDYTPGLAALVVPFFYALLKESSGNMEFSALPREELESVRIHLFWTVQHFCNMDGVVEYLNDPSKTIKKTMEFLKIIDEETWDFMNEKNVDFTASILNWGIYLLLPVFRKMDLIMMLWDKYVLYGEIFLDFHACVCATLISQVGNKIRSTSDPNQQVEYLQKLNLSDWSYFDMGRFVTRVLKSSATLNLWEKLQQIKADKLKKLLEVSPSDNEEEESVVGPSSETV
eukprot:TRINITY_DN4799_c0_g1_i2.p1 TRINITY_DN4799_c0_g1~~TRINITY_DN4799_c0_g1_i2.p1  ORF type:complete len:331 (-),score=73.29 TRINITY_DN4799_c0_g1_i2:72-1064(-)